MLVSDAFALGGGAVRLAGEASIVPAARFGNLLAGPRLVTSFYTQVTYNKPMKAVRWDSGGQFWLFTVYDKNEADDLTSEQRRALKGLMKAELEARTRR